MVMIPYTKFGVVGGGSPHGRVYVKLYPRTYVVQTYLTTERVLT